ncbi:hypothetical protein GCM10027155_04830 [Acinetobacter apis]
MVNIVIPIFKAWLCKNGKYADKGETLTIMSTALAIVIDELLLKMPQANKINKTARFKSSDVIIT